MDILARAKDLAARNGEVTPAVAGEVLTSSAMAASATHAGPGTASPRRMVALTGSFTGFMAKVPKGGKMATGDTMLVTFDASTCEITDWSIQHGQVNLQSLGTTGP